MSGEQAIFNQESRLSGNPDIHHSKVVSSELRTLVLDILYPVSLISISIVDTLDFLLNPLFWISLLV